MLPMTRRRLPLTLALAFIVGGGSAEVAVRTKAALDRAREEREMGSVGNLIELTLRDANGDIVARPRAIAPKGRSSTYLLKDPGNPERALLAWHFEAMREADGGVSLEYELSVPEHRLNASGRLTLTPGVEQHVPLGDGTIVASFFALPVPSKAFDAYLESSGEPVDIADAI